MRRLAAACLFLAASAAFAQPARQDPIVRYVTVSPLDKDCVYGISAPLLTREGDVYYCQQATSKYKLRTTSGGAPPVGPEGAVQHRVGDLLGGESAFSYNPATNVLTLAGQLSSLVADGTAPFTVVSGTKVSGLHADKLDGFEGADFIRKNQAAVTWAADIANDLQLGPFQAARRDSSNTGWEPYTPAAAGGGDVGTVGDCDTGDCFTNVPANRVLASPSSGSSGAVGARALVNDDVPDTITLTNLTQIGTRLYSDLQSKPTDLSAFETPTEDAVPVGSGAEYVDRTLPAGAVSYVPGLGAGIFAQATLGDMAASTAAQLAALLGADVTGTSGGFVRASGPTLSNVLFSSPVRLPRGTDPPSNNPDCDVAGEVGRVYVHEDPAAAFSSFYVCANTGASAYGWELYTRGAKIQEDDVDVLAAPAILNFGTGFDTTVPSAGKVTVSLTEGAGGGGGWTDTGTVVKEVTSSDEVEIGPVAGTGAKLTISGDAANQVPVQVVGAASQSANLYEWKLNSGAIPTYVGPAGDIQAPTVNTAAQSTPTARLKDAEIDGDQVAATWLANCTATGAAAEKCDVTLQALIDNALATFFNFDATGGSAEKLLTLGHASGQVRFNGASTASRVVVTDASGNATSSSVTTTDLGNAATNGANCSAGSYPLGVDAANAAEGCTADDDAPEVGDFDALVGGRSTTYDAGGNQLDADDELYTDTYTFLIDSPVAGDNGKYATPCAGTNGCTITKVWCSTDTGTVDINLNERAETTPNTDGTDVLSAVLVCDSGSQSSCSSGCDVNTITNGPIDHNDPVTVEVSNPVSSPTVLRLHFRATRNDS